jgi:hypothetical protein
MGQLGEALLLLAAVLVSLLWLRRLRGLLFA